jgi:3,4-dihydroxy 2-butanone 4-phosphate synthase / GTP cyclohydrolase II
MRPLAPRSADATAPDPVRAARVRVEAALEAFRHGRPVVVVDDHDREDEGDIFIPAAAVGVEQMAMLLRHTTGIVCVAMPGERLDALELVPMVPPGANEEVMGTAFTVSVDARRGTTTGVSAADRVATARALADPATGPDDLVRPGHVFPLRARAGGVLERRGHTEAAVDLARLAGVTPAVVLAELMHADGTMMRTSAIRTFCADEGLVLLSVEDIVLHRTAPRVERRASAVIPCDVGEVELVALYSEADDHEHAAVVVGQLDPSSGRPPLVRLHSECLTGDLLGSRRCDCGEQLHESLRRMREDGGGVLVYLRGHEGRGIGLSAKLAAYRLQDQGCDTVEANELQGLPVDARSYETAAEILRTLGLRRVRLLSNNPLKAAELRARGVDVTEEVPLLVGVNPHNVRYLTTKRDRLGHRLGAVDERVSLATS